MSTLLNDLPTIIDGPGEYLTRDGGRVTIHDVNGKGTFNARGSRWKIFRNKWRPRIYGIWHPSGRYLPLREDENDIISKSTSRMTTKTHNHKGAKP